MRVVPVEFMTAINESQRHRGWIANAYAQVEFLLGDLIVRATEMPAYDSIPRGVPHYASKRVKKVKAILDLSGPLSNYSRQIGDLLTEFESHAETRNLLAHGFCEFLHTPSGDMGVQFQKWHRVEGRHDARLIKCFRVGDLAEEGKRIIEFSQRVMELFQSIHADLGWVGRPDK